MIVNWFKKNWMIMLILLIGVFFRLYKIDAYMTFLGDEGRDVIIVRNLLVHADPILIGPGTSVGGMYLGPLYYYFMAPFLLLADFSPVGPAIGVALLGVLTIYLVYLAGLEWFSKKAGLIAALLFAISPTVILYSHSSWNPNIMPFFSLLSIYAIWKVYESASSAYSEKKYNWLIISAISFAFVLQSHYLGVLLAPVLLFYWYKSKVTWKHTAVSVLIFGFLMSPLLIFDIRHNFLNSKALYKFLTVRQETVSINLLSPISKTYPIFEQINSSLLTVKQKPVGKLVTLITILLIVTFVLNKKLFTLHRSQFTLLLLWLISGLLGLGIYNQTINDHYFGFLFPAPFLLVGYLLSKLYDSKFRIFSILFLSILVFINLSNNPFKKNPNNQMQRAQNVAEKIIEISGDKPYNLAVLSNWNYEDGYEYFLKKENSKVVDIDSQLPETVTDQLLVTCENLRDKCDPTHSAKAEVANFGWSKIESEYEVDGVIIFKLVHTK